MRGIQAVVTLVLLALWLPASLHCELEWSGLAGDGVACHNHENSTAQDTDADGCAIVDAGGCRLSGAATFASAAEPPYWLLLEPGIPPPPEFIPVPVMDSTAAPPEFIRRWSFVVRAAPPSRAPTSVG